MDSQTTMRTFKYKSSQQPIFNVTETPIQYRSFAPVLDASFSSYLKPEEPVNNSNVDDAEINVFDAHKYFNEGGDPNANKRVSLSSNHKNVNVNVMPGELSTGPRLSSVSSVDGYGRNFRTSSSRATPTASSEASWNSQTGLLANPPGSMGVSLKNLPDRDRRKGGSAAKWIFCGKCRCTGKKSVQVEEASSEHRAVAATIRISNTAKTDAYTIRRSHSQSQSMTQAQTQSHRPGEIRIEEISSVSGKSSVSDELRESQQRITSKPVRISTESKFSSSTARQQRVSVTGRAFNEGTPGFSFPILSPSFPAKPALEALKIPNKALTPVIDPGRYSIEVFQPLSEPMDTPKNISSITDGAGGDRRHCHFPGIPRTSITPTDDDVGSDASSDLFEIESFSTQTTMNYHQYHRRDSLDDAATFNARHIAVNNGIGNSYGARRSLDEPETPSVAQTECYAPSEVSIDWSVTTAEGFERASMTNYSISASEMGNETRMRHGGGGETGYNNHGESGKRKGNGGGLLSCRHEEAVSVGPRPIKCVAGGGAPPHSSLISISEHVSSRPHKASKPPLAKAYSASLSLAFAT